MSQSETNNLELVSIVMPTYNSAKFVAQSIDSIIAQTYPKWELLITDDCSSDETLTIVRHYTKIDSRIHLFKLETNSGAGPARNNSIRMAQGRYIAFCDSDDLWLPQKLEKQLFFMRQKKCCFCFAPYYVCDASGKTTGYIPAPSSVSLTETKHDDKIGFLTAIYDTLPYGKFFMPPLRKRQDWAYVLLILKKCKRAFAISEPLAYYRKSPGSISHNKFTLVKYNAQVYQHVFGYSPFHSYLYLFFLFLPTYTAKIITNKLINLIDRKHTTKAKDTSSY